MYEKIDLLPEGQVSEEYYEKAKDTIQKLNEDIANVCAKWDLGDSYFYDVRLSLTDEGGNWFELGYERHFSEDASICLRIMFQDGKTPLIAFACYDSEADIHHYDMCPVDSWFFDQFLTCSLIAMNTLCEKCLG